MTNSQDCSSLARQTARCFCPSGCVLSALKVICTGLPCDYRIEINISEGWRGRVSSAQPVSDCPGTSMSWGLDELKQPVWVLGTAGLPGKSYECEPTLGVSYIMSDPQEP